MDKLRLLLFEQCDRKCDGCCNKDWDLKNLPIATDFSSYDEILLTGGEPMLKPRLVADTIIRIRKENPSVRIFVYTAKVNDIVTTLKILELADGITITLHEQKDVAPYIQLSHRIAKLKRKGNLQHKNLRLNIFKGIDINDSNFEQEGWIIKNNIKWIKDCPLPDGEKFMRLPTSIQSADSAEKGVIGG